MITMSTSAVAPSRRAMLASTSAVQQMIGAVALTLASPVSMPTRSAPTPSHGAPSPAGPPPRRAAGDRRRGVDAGVTGEHADPVGAEDLAQREELLAHQGLDRRGVDAAPAGGQAGGGRRGGGPGRPGPGP